MKKEFVPYEEALAMKELGFEEECIATYIKDELFLGISSKVINSDVLLAPLYQQAFRWFREKYNQHCFIQYHGKPKYINFVYNDLRVEYRSMDELIIYDTYEEAQLACLRKLIEICSEK